MAREGGTMARKRYTVEQIIAKLREAEIELAQGAKTPKACRRDDDPSLR